MIDYKEFVAKQFVGKRVHFRSSCTIPVDVTGEVVSYKKVGAEIVYNVLVTTPAGITRTIPVGENMSKLKFDFV